jgi:cobalt/nickel transport system permease protein
LHHVVLDRWSRRSSVIHCLDPRAKIAATIITLIGIAALHPVALTSYAIFGVALAAIILAARLPAGSVLVRATFVLPFSALFAIVSWLAGDPQRALSITAKSYLSCLSVLALVATTPLPALLRGLEWLRVPGLVITVAQFLYRYLFVISEQAQHMLVAARCRTGPAVTRAMHFRAAAGSLGVLFGRSYARAEGIQHAMAARGYSGRFPTAERPPARSSDALYLALTAAVAIAANLLALRRT